MAPAARAANGSATADAAEGPPFSSTVATAAANDAGAEPEPAADGGSVAAGLAPSASSASLASSSRDVESQLDDLVWLQILRGLGEDVPLIHARVSLGRQQGWEAS